MMVLPGEQVHKTYIQFKKINIMMVLSSEQIAKG